MFDIYTQYHQEKAWLELFQVLLLWEERIQILHLMPDIVLNERKK